jgi:hypothetical protein
MAPCKLGNRITLFSLLQKRTFLRLNASHPKVFIEEILHRSFSVKVMSGMNLKGRVSKKNLAATAKWAFGKSKYFATLKCGKL